MNEQEVERSELKDCIDWKVALHWDNGQKEAIAPTTTR